jgi:hypothetical protein
LKKDNVTVEYDGLTLYQFAKNNKISIEDLIAKNPSYIKTTPECMKKYTEDCKHLPIKPGVKLRIK